MSLGRQDGFAPFAPVLLRLDRERLTGRLDLLVSNSTIVCKLAGMSSSNGRQAQALGLEIRLTRVQ